MSKLNEISVFNNNWYNLDESIPCGDVVEKVQDILTSSGPSCKLYIGTDAQAHKKMEFITVVVIYDPILRKGGRGFFTRNKVANKEVKQLWTKLYTETQLSLELAVAFQDAGVDPNVMEVHIDANHVESASSTRYAKSLAGMIIGSGFNVKIKPDSWAATWAAERLAKHRHVPTKERRKRKKVA